MPSARRLSCPPLPQLRRLPRDGLSAMYMVQSNPFSLLPQSILVAAVIFAGDAAAIRL